MVRLALILVAQFELAELERSFPFPLANTMMVDVNEIRLRMASGTIEASVSAAYQRIQQAFGMASPEAWKKRKSRNLAAGAFARGLDGRTRAFYVQLRGVRWPDRKRLAKAINEVGNLAGDMLGRLGLRTVFPTFYLPIDIQCALHTAPVKEWCQVYDPAIASVAVYRAMPEVHWHAVFLNERSDGRSEYRWVVYLGGKLSNLIAMKNPAVSRELCQLSFEPLPKESRCAIVGQIKMASRQAWIAAGQHPDAKMGLTARLQSGLQASGWQKVEALETEDSSAVMPPLWKQSRRRLVMNVAENQQGSGSTFVLLSYEEAN